MLCHSTEDSLETKKPDIPMWCTKGGVVAVHMHMKLPFPNPGSATVVGLCPVVRGVARGAIAPPPPTHPSNIGLHQSDAALLFLLYTISESTSQQRLCITDPLNRSLQSNTYTNSGSIASESPIQGSNGKSLHHVLLALPIRRNYL